MVTYIDTYIVTRLFRIIRGPLSFSVKLRSKLILILGLNIFRKLFVFGLSIKSHILHNFEEKFCKGLTAVQKLFQFKYYNAIRVRQGRKKKDKANTIIHIYVEFMKIRGKS